MRLGRIEVSARTLTRSGPGAIWQTIRRNHALEHATVHHLGRTRPSLRLVGRSTAGGFYLYGDVDRSTIERAATEAVRELGADPALAVHPRCGTNLAVTGLLAGLAAFAVDSSRHRPRLALLPQVLLASLWAVLLAQPLGAAVQRSLTTSPDVAGARLGPVERRPGRTPTHFVPIFWD